MSIKKPSITQLSKLLIILTGYIFLYTNIVSSPVYSASEQHTTIRLEIVASFTGSLTYTGSSAIFLNNIYRTTGTTQYVVLHSSLNASYHLHQGVANSTGVYTTPYDNIQTITLLSGDGQKDVYITYTPLFSITGDTLTPPPVIYFLDTTPPPLTDTYAGPSGIQQHTDPTYFSRYPSIDTGIGLETYIIQISNSIHFSTAIEFTTTGTELMLGGGSIGVGGRYRRWGARDTLGNTTFSYPTEFTVQGSSPINGGGGGISSLPTPQPTPVSDQCPTGDVSGNYFDGICSSITQKPVLINLPQEHQVTDTLSRREKVLENIKNPRQEIYKFPDYDPPKSLTIHEYPPSYVYQDIYESDVSRTNLTAYYQPSFGKQTRNPSVHSIVPISSFASKFDGIYLSRSTNYLAYRFVATTNSCSAVGQFCPIDPICRDTRSTCYQEEFICKLTTPPTQWCLRNLRKN